MTVRLRKSFIKLLEEDREFRYTVAGYLGLAEVLKRLDSIEQEIKSLREGQEKLWEGQNKLWEEVKSLREGQEKLWESSNKLWEGQNKLWEEVKSLREGQEKLWESSNKLWEEVRALREGQNMLWEEVRSLREGQEKLWESNSKLWEEVRALREGQNKLWEEVRDLRKAYQGLSKRVSVGFAELGAALGVTYEIHAAAYIKVLLEELGFPQARVGRGWVAKNGEVLDIDVFSEDPLVVGEVTTSLRDVEEAEREVAKLLDRVVAVEAKYGRKPFLVVLSVGVAPESVAEILREKAERQDIKLILGREIEEALSG
ncbi:MAG: hypothetical protein RMH74_02375 [Candidatus Caldarchaeum sp.]|nr:hypothetical protein [Candidatus Caldarchaeum sp.]